MRGVMDDKIECTLQIPVVRYFPWQLSGTIWGTSHRDMRCGELPAENFTIESVLIDILHPGRGNSDLDRKDTSRRNCAVDGEVLNVSQVHEIRKIIVLLEIRIAFKPGGPHSYHSPGAKAEYYILPEEPTRRVVAFASVSRRNLFAMRFFFWHNSYAQPCRCSLTMFLDPFSLAIFSWFIAALREPRRFTRSTMRWCAFLWCLQRRKATRGNARVFASSARKQAPISGRDLS